MENCETSEVGCQNFMKLTDFGYIIYRFDALFTVRIGQARLLNPTNA